MKEWTDEALMQAYAAGDRRAFRVLFERYAPTLLRVARRHLPGEDDAKEVVQQTLFQLHAARRDFDTSRRFRPWLLTILMNLVRQYYRRRKRRPEVDLEHAPEPQDSTATDAPLQSAQSASLVRNAMQELPSGQRDVLVLHWLEERPYAEVGEILGLSEAAVRVRAHRAYGKLREILSPALEGAL